MRRRHRGALEAAARRVAAWRAVEWVGGLATAISALGIYAGPAEWADGLLGGLLEATADAPEARAVVLMRRAKLRVTIDHVDTSETLEEATEAAEQAPGKLRRQVARVYARYYLDQRQAEQA